jgi:outer membrane lipase/esterase
MNFNSNARRRLPWAATAALAVAVSAFVAACGGSTTQYEPFQAERLFAFGDETSVLRRDGRRFGVNGLDEFTSAFDCNLNPMWVQVVAQYYGLVFAECNTGATPPEPRAFMLASAGARVADLAAQVEAQVAAGGLRAGDMALVAAGANDVLDLYAQYPIASEASLVAEAQLRGERLAAVVNRLVELGAKVIVANLPDMGMSPLARRDAVANQGSGVSRTELMSRLTSAFNERLGVKVLLDGRFVGLAQMDLRTQSAQRSPGSFGFVDVSNAVCTTALPDCTSATVVTGSNPAGFLWADSTRLAPGGQNQLAGLALERAQRNPF